MISLGARSGASTRAGCGSNVSTVGVKPRSRAIATTRRMISPMAGMDAIEIADGDHGRPEIRRHFGRRTEDSHAVDFDLKTVVGEKNSGRQRRLSGGMRQIVADMREVSAAGPAGAARSATDSPLWNASDAACAAAHRGTAHPVPASFSSEALGNLAVIGQIGRIAETEAVDRRLSPCITGMGSNRRPSTSNGSSVDQVDVQLRHRGRAFAASKTYSKTRWITSNVRRDAIDRNVGLWWKLKGRTSSSPSI